MKNKVALISIIAGIALFIITKSLGASFLVAFILGISIPILYLLSQSKARKLGIIGGIGIIILDIFLFILTLIPVQSYNIKVEEFYKRRGNYLKIFIKDKKKELKNLQLIIFRKPKAKIIKLNEYKKGKKILLYEGDKIYFRGNKKYKSFAVIYLWDGTILRITPGTKINLDKINKNLQNLPESKTQISVDNGNVWFKVIRLIKGGDGMQIKTGKGQTLIIRGTAGLISKNTSQDTTYVVDYEHFIELKVGKKSKILNEKQGAKIEKNKIKITNNINELLKQIGLNENILKAFNILDKEDLIKFQNDINNYIKSQLKNINSFQKLKIKLFSLGDKNYYKILENLQSYDYLIGKTKQIPSILINNPNLAFIAGNLGDYKVRVKYLYNQIKSGVNNSDIYKTYIINLGIEKGVNNIGKFTKQYLDNLEEDFKGFQDELEKTLNNFNF